MEKPFHHRFSFLSPAFLFRSFLFLSFLFSFTSLSVALAHGFPWRATWVALFAYGALNERREAVRHMTREILRERQGREGKTRNFVHGTAWHGVSRRRNGFPLARDVGRTLLLRRTVIRAARRCYT